MSAAPTATYPKFFQTIVGVGPDKMRTLTAEDVEILIEAFAAATGVDPLQTTRPLKDIFKETVGAGYTA